MSMNQELQKQYLQMCDTLYTILGWCNSLYSRQLNSHVVLSCLFLLPALINNELLPSNTWTLLTDLPSAALCPTGVESGGPENIKEGTEDRSRHFFRKGWSGCDYRTRAHVYVRDNCQTFVAIERCQVNHEIVCINFTRINDMKY